VRCDVTSAEIASYRDNGFVVLERFLDDGEVRLWRDAVEGAVRAREADPGLLPSINQERWPDEYGFRQHMNLWETDPEMRELLFAPEIARVAAHLSGATELRVWYDQSFIKKGWGFPTPLHQDNPWWSFSTTDAITMWLALDDVDERNGALVYLPGSHRELSWQQCAGEGLGDVIELAPSWAGITPVCCPVPAGSVIWHNGLTVHGSGANMSHAERRALNFALMPSPARFNGVRNILPDEVFHRYRVGDLLADDALNPRIFPPRDAVIGPGGSGNAPDEINDSRPRVAAVPVPRPETLRS